MRREGQKCELQTSAQPTHHLSTDPREKCGEGEMMKDFHPDPKKKKYLRHQEPLLQPSLISVRHGPKLFGVGRRVDEFRELSLGVREERLGSVEFEL